MKVTDSIKTFFQQTAAFVKVKTGHLVGHVAFHVRTSAAYAHLKPFQTLGMVAGFAGLGVAANLAHEFACKKFVNYVDGQSWAPTTKERSIKAFKAVSFVATGAAVGGVGAAVPFGLAAAGVTLVPPVLLTVAIAVSAFALAKLALWAFNKYGKSANKVESTEANIENQANVQNKKNELASTKAKVEEKKNELADAEILATHPNCNDPKRDHPNGSATAAAIFV